MSANRNTAYYLSMHWAHILMLSLGYLDICLCVHVSFLLTWFLTAVLSPVAEVVCVVVVKDHDRNPAAGIFCGTDPMWHHASLEKWVWWTLRGSLTQIWTCFSMTACEAVLWMVHKQELSYVWMWSRAGSWVLVSCLVSICSVCACAYIYTHILFYNYYAFYTEYKIWPQKTEYSELEGATRTIKSKFWLHTGLPKN